MNIINYFLTLISLVVIDSIWLFSMGGHYKRWLAAHFAPSVQYPPIIIFYFLYALGVLFFVIAPALKNGTGFLQIFLTGAFFGLIAYGAYDFTNQATLTNWPTYVTIIDMAWGAMLTGLASTLVVYLQGLIK